MATPSSSSSPQAAPSPPEDVLSFWLGEDHARVASEPLAWPNPAWSRRWFFGGQEIDDQIRARFLPLLEQLGGGGGKEAEDGASPARWLEEDLEEAAASPSSSSPPLRALAGIIAMDQFSRNAFRGTARAFALDAQALRWSRALIARGLHRRLAPAARLFVLLPLEHSECLENQRESVRLFGEMLADAEEAAAAAATAAGADDAAAAASSLVENAKSTLAFADRHLEVIERWGRFPGRNAALGRESTAEEVEGLASGAIARW